MPFAGRVGGISARIAKAVRLVGLHFHKADAERVLALD